MAVSDGLISMPVLFPSSHLLKYTLRNSEPVWETTQKSKNSLTAAWYGSWNQSASKGKGMVEERHLGFLSMMHTPWTASKKTNTILQSEKRPKILNAD